MGSGAWLRTLKPVVFWTALAISSIGSRPVLAISLTPSTAPTAVPTAVPSVIPTGSPAAGAVVAPSAAPQRAAPAAIGSGAPTAPASASSPTGGSPAPSWSPGASPTASSRATPTASAGASAPAATAGAGTPSASPRLAGRASDAAFCPQIGFTRLAGCESLPAPIKFVGLANSGTPIAIALIGLLLIAAGWVIYRRSRKALSVTTEEEPASPPDAAHR